MGFNEILTKIPVPLSVRLDKGSRNHTHKRDNYILLTTLHRVWLIDAQSTKNHDPALFDAFIFVHLHLLSVFAPPLSPFPANYRPDHQHLVSKIMSLLLQVFGIYPTRSTVFTTAGPVEYQSVITTATTFSNQSRFYTNITTLYVLALYASGRFGGTQNIGPLLF